MNKNLTLLLILISCSTVFFSCSEAEHNSTTATTDTTRVKVYDTITTIIEKPSAPANNETNTDDGTDRTEPNTGRSSDLPADSTGTSGEGTRQHPPKK